MSNVDDNHSYIILTRTVEIISRGLNMSGDLRGVMNSLKFPLGFYPFNEKGIGLLPGQIFYWLEHFCQIIPS